MPRAKHKPETTRSEHWLRLAVNHFTPELNRRLIEAFGFDEQEEIEWLSPLKSDEYSEYYDQEFLDRLGVLATSHDLRDYWPSRGPQWDGLARTLSGKYILVEAKAYPAEAQTNCIAASPASLALIRESLEKTKSYYGATGEADWLNGYYQYANRLAHLYFLRHLNVIDAYLLFLNFADAPDVSNPCDRAGWEAAADAIDLALGISTSTIHATATVVWSVPEMISSTGPKLP